MFTIKLQKKQNLIILIYVGYYFLDACPTAFKVILNWLRYKEILDKEVDPDNVIPVADYFGLPELCEKLEAMKKPDFTRNNNDADVIRLNVGGTIFETSRTTLTQKPNSKKDTSLLPAYDVQCTMYILLSALYIHTSTMYYINTCETIACYDIVFVK